MGILESVIGLVVGAVITQIVNHLNQLRKKAEQQKKLIKQVFRSCDTRAVYTRTHAQTSFEAMFQAVTACRFSLQKLRTLIEPEMRQQMVADIIGCLAEIESLETENPESETLERIDDAKKRIIGLLEQLGNDTGVTYTLPKNLSEEIMFLKLEDAIKPVEDTNNA